MTTPRELLLPKLNRVREIKPGQYCASCPTDLHKHGDRSAGLRIKEAENGKLLLTCGAGCTADAIVAAVGLTMADLFQQREKRLGEKRTGPTITRAMCDAADLEVRLLTVATAKLQRREPLTPEDKARIHIAMDRLTAFWRAALCQ